MNRVTLLVVFLALVALPAAAGSKPIPFHARVYISPNTGFETYVTAAIIKKGVPVIVVTDKAQADYLVTDTVDRGKEPNWAQTWFLKKRGATEDASIYIVSTKDRSVVWAYAVHKYDARHGLQSTAEAIAKHLKDEVAKK